MNLLIVMIYATAAIASLLVLVATIVCAYRARREDSRPYARPTIKQENEHLCLGCAQLLNDRRAVMRLVYEPSLDGKLLKCPACHCIHVRWFT